jgi:oxygen-independent coproporphyrinogen-3 oxidase
MAGIYLHIPFCKQACHYCNFHFSTSLKLQNDFLDALLKEIAIRRDYLGSEEVETVYFGGGTPSLLNEEALAAIMDRLHALFPIADGAEVTFEANPDDINADSLNMWKTQGINRLSIGIQSFFEEDLLWMNRAHTADQARDCVLLAMDTGISNMSIDLIYGMPTMSDEKWQHNLAAAADLRIPHLSCYALTVEPGTALDAMTRKRKVKEISNDDQARQFLMMSDYLQSRRYEHYEISNLALPGMRSRHNSSYWSGAKYLGLGPSAHSFDRLSRQWNISNNALYIKSLADDKVPFEIEMLSEKQRTNEYIMTSLRLTEGLDIRKIGREFSEQIITDGEKFIQRGWMENRDNHLILTREGKLFADGIAAELFV